MFTTWVKNSSLGSRKIKFITWVNPSSEYYLGQIHNLGQNRFTRGGSMSWTGWLKQYSNITNNNIMILFELIKEL